MTNGELLLHWLTHVQEGSWPGFRRAVATIEGEHEEAATAGRMRSRLSDLAHVEFFIGGTNRWRTFAPLLGGLCDPLRAVLAGGRTPRLVDALVRSCADEGCQLASSPMPDGPDSILVVGRPEAIGRAARGAGVTYVRSLADALCMDLESIPSVLAAALPGAPPTNWDIRSFDLRALRWVDNLLPDTAYEYRSRHGPRRHFVRGARHGLLSLDRRYAVYAAAYLSRVPLLSYDETSGALRLPRNAPLPEPMTRAAAACAGAPAAVEDGQLVYHGVAPAVAGILMAAAGQRPLPPHWISPAERSPR